MISAIRHGRRATLAGGLLLGGLAACTSESKLESGDSREPTESLDVVIVGAGAAGLAAAMDLPGAVVLEADEAPGGRALYSGAVLQFVGTTEQEEAGVADSVATAVADWPTLTGGPATATTERWLTASAAVHDRLGDLGLTFTLADPDPLLHRRRLHMVGGEGSSLVAALVAALPASVEVRTGVRVTGLRLDGAKVVGVATEAGPIDARRVIVATGGFANRADLLERYVTWPAGSWAIGDDPYSEGSAIDWALTEGLGVAHPEAVGANANVVGLASAAGGATRARNDPWIWVDETGSRFVDESQGWSLTLAAAAEAHPPTWAIAASAELEPAVDAADWAAIAPAIRCAPDAVALAAELGLDADPFVATLAAVAHTRAAGGEDAWGRDAPSLPNLTGELCAFPPGRLASKSFGGLDVDDRGQVRTADGTPIAGLYAAGEAAGMAQPGLGGAWGCDGSLSAVIWSGWQVAATLRE